MTVSTGSYMPHLHFIVDEDLCYGCGACIGLCPTNALSMKGLGIGGAVSMHIL